jgi:hypothetical protein
VPSRRSPSLLAAALASTLAVGCHAPRPPPAPPAAPPGASVAAPLAPWRYAVTAAPGARELFVDAQLVAPLGATLGVESAGRFLSGVEIARGDLYAPLPAGRDASGYPSFRLPPCPPDGCRVRYRFALQEAAREVGEIGCAEEASGAFLTSPSAWLLHPAEPADGQTFELRVMTPPGTAFIAGILPEPTSPFDLPPAVYAAELADLPNPAWGAFGALRLSRVELDDETIDVAVVPGTFEAGEAALKDWVSLTARAIRGYYGRGSIRRVLVVIVPKPGRGVGFARTLGNGGASIVAYVGVQSQPQDFAASWALVHEMLHVSFPTMPREQAWLSEGIATYVEPLIRARLKILSPETVFAHFVERMPFGLPQRGEGGLDGTRSWGRTYWGGALFCLLADMAIRERTHGRRSLDDALRAVLDAGGNVSQRWEMEQVITLGDAATGVPVLRELYAQMGDRPVTVDLNALWRRLGVDIRGGRVVLDDSAELAPLRRAMTGR